MEGCRTLLVGTGCSVGNVKVVAELVRAAVLECLVGTGCSVVDNKSLSRAAVLECGALLVVTGCSVVDNEVPAEVVRAAVLELTTIRLDKKKDYAGF